MGIHEIEKNLRLHVDRLAGVIGPRYLRKPKTIQATVGYIESQWRRGDSAGVFVEASKKGPKKCPSSLYACPNR
jgi:hypothetical protein